jgi:hypothetical protein
VQIPGGNFDFCTSRTPERTQVRILPLIRACPSSTSAPRLTCGYRVTRTALWGASASTKWAEPARADRAPSGPEFDCLGRRISPSAARSRVHSSG